MIKWQRSRRKFGKILLSEIARAAGETYDVQSSFDLRQWSRLDRLTLSDFQAWYLDAGATNAARFYRLSKPTLAPIWFERQSLDGNNLIQLTLHSESGQPLAIESSTNLLNWVTVLQTNNAAGMMRIAGGAAGDSTLRFYRAKALPRGSAEPPARGSEFALQSTAARRMTNRVSFPANPSLIF